MPDSLSAYLKKLTRLRVEAQIYCNYTGSLTLGLDVFIKDYVPMLYSRRGGTHCNSVLLKC